MRIPFGKNNGRDTSEVDDRYLMWLSDADEWNQEKGKPWDKPFKVSLDIRIAARAELERRGFRKKGLRWE